MVPKAYVLTFFVPCITLPLWLQTFLLHPCLLSSSFVITSLIEDGQSLG